jgi:hypothetical protein
MADMSKDNRDWLDGYHDGQEIIRAVLRTGLMPVLPERHIRGTRQRKEYVKGLRTALDNSGNLME